MDFKSTGDCLYIGRDIRNTILGVLINSQQNEIDIGKNYLTCGINHIEIRLTNDKAIVYCDNNNLGEINHSLHDKDLRIGLDKWQWKSVGIKNFNYRIEVM